jgi:hypothetical protein
MRVTAFFHFGALVFLFATAPGPSYGQSTAPAPTATQQPAAASATPPPADPQGQAAPLPNAKPSKVWTNDEIGALRGDRGVSVVGDHTPQKVSAASAKTKGYSQEKDPAWYRNQLQPLQAEIEKLDAQIEKTKAFLNGEKVNDQLSSTHAYYGVAGNPQDQLEKLEAKRDKDVAKLNDLLDRARHNDIPPGALR